MRNTPLLEQTMTEVRDHPELHNQDRFFTETDCGTACCFGGTALLLAGYERLPNFRWPGEWVMTPSGAATAWDAARDLLGLNDAEALTLFSPANCCAHLERMVKALVNGEDITTGISLGG